MKPLDVFYAENVLFYLHVCGPSGPLVCPSVMFTRRQKKSGRARWIVRAPGDKSCDHGGRRKVGATWPSTVCSMFNSPVHHNSQHPHIQQRHKIHGPVQVPSVVAPCTMSFICKQSSLLHSSVFLPCIIAEVFFLCVFPKIQLFIKGLVTVPCKSALIFLAGEKKGKR